MDHRLVRSLFLQKKCSTTLFYFLIAGVRSAPFSWERWPRHLLNPYHSSIHTERERPDTSSSRPALTEKDGKPPPPTPLSPPQALCERERKEREREIGREGGREGGRERKREREIAV